MCGGLGGELTPNVFNMMYFNALHIFKFESNPLKILVIWFIKGFHTFKVSIKYDSFYKIPIISKYLNPKWVQ